MKRIFLFLFASFSLLAEAQNEGPSDSVGVWAVNNDKVTRINKLSHQGVKIGGGLGTAVSFGIAKTKAKFVFKGATSETIFDKKAHLRLYFGNPPVMDAANLYMFTPSNSIKNFEIAKFDVKKDKRMLTGVSISILGSKTGASADKNAQVEFKEIRSGVYDVFVTGEPGEYCLIYTAYGTGGASGVFDFTIQ